MSSNDYATTDLANLFAAHTNSFELDIFWVGAPLTVLALRVNGLQIDSDEVRNPPAARFNIPAPSNGQTFLVEAAIGPGNGTARNIVIGIKDDTTGRQFQVDHSDSLSIGDDLWFVRKSVTIS
ncbi:MAG TPA: hypothetical protein VK745_21715 [Polyangiaceae bacterium]|jgi:hypothetical protein|nr:hypothetical protein [Polyangiaceae bacterium]